MDDSKKGISLDRIAELVPSGVIRLSGKRYPTTRGLIAIMGRYGVESIETELLEHDPEVPRAVVRAVVIGTRGAFSAHGDCGPKSTSRNILPHCVRMAETRAIGRALRWYLGLGETVADELGAPEEPAPRRARPGPPESPATIAAADVGELEPAAELGELLPLLRKLQATGCTVEEVEGLLASRGRPALKKMSASDLEALIKWLPTEEGSRALHGYHTRDLEGS